MKLTRSEIEVLGICLRHYLIYETDQMVPGKAHIIEIISSLIEKLNKEVK